MKQRLWSIWIVLAFMLAPAFAHAQSGPNLVLGQGQLNATSTETANGAVSEWQVFVGKGYSGDVTQLVLGLGGIGSSGSAGEPQFAGAFFGGIRQASTTGNMYAVDSDCNMAASTTDQLSSGFPSGSAFVALHPVSETNNGCTLDPTKYTSVWFYVYRTHSINSYWADYSYGSLTNSKGWNWTRSVNQALDCSNPASGQTCNTGWYPYFSLLGPGWSLIPTTTSTGVLFSGAIDFCNEALASSTGIGATIANGACIAGGFLFIPTSASLETFMSIPQSISQTFPFSWLAQMRTLLESSQASSTDNFVSVHSSFGTSTSPFYIQNLYLVSTTSAASFLPDSLRNMFKTILGVGFWMLGALFLYRKLNNVWHTT